MLWTLNFHTSCVISKCYISSRFCWFTHILEYLLQPQILSQWLSSWYTPCWLTNRKRTLRGPSRIWGERGGRGRMGGRTGCCRQIKDLSANETFVGKSFFGKTANYHSKSRDIQERNWGVGNYSYQYTFCNLSLSSRRQVSRSLSSIMKCAAILFSYGLVNRLTCFMF